MMSYRSILIALGLFAVTGCGHRHMPSFSDSSADRGQSDTIEIILDTAADAGVDYTMNDTLRADSVLPVPDSEPVPDQSPDQYVNQPPVVKFLYTVGGAPGQQTGFYFSSTDPEGTVMTYSIASTPSISAKWHFLGSPKYLLVRTDDTLPLSAMNNNLIVPLQFSFTATDADGKSTTVTVDRNLNRYNTGATLWCGPQQQNFAPDLDIAQKLFSGMTGFTMAPGNYKASGTTDPKGLAFVVAAWTALSSAEKQRVADRSDSYNTIIPKMNAMTGSGSCYYTHIGVEDLAKP